MRRFLLGATALIALLGGVAISSAQPAVHETQTHGGAVSFAPEHGRVLREHATTQHYSSAQQPDFQVQVGATLPNSAQLHPLPDAIGTHVPAARSYQYSIINNRHVVVDPGSRRIIHAFE